MNNISLHVKGLGKIESATVELAPLTLFVGDNNSGKSYLMTVLYGLQDINLLYNLASNGFGPYKKNKAVQRCLELIEKINDTAFLEENAHKVTEEEHKDFNALFNLLLKHNKDRFIENIFNYKFKLDDISINIPYVPGKMKIWVEIISREFPANDKNQIINENVYFLRFSEDSRGRAIGLPESISRELTLARIVIAFFSLYVNNSFNRRVLFFPTSRTGFMLGYKSMISKSIDSTFGLISTFKKESANLTLSKPSVDFLQRINELTSFDKKRPKKKNEFIPKIIDGLLKGIDGNLEIIEQSSEIVFSPHGSDKKLPLYITSGVVTELAPLILFLLNYNCSLLMMEEPEMGLHPKLQKEIARVLVRLSNNGIPVIATTHSDTIIQHINNMIKLSNIKRNKTLLKNSGYEGDDVLSCDKVRIYQFDTDNKSHRTKVTNLECSESGFETPTFYNVLLDMYQESKSFEDKIK